MARTSRAAKGKGYKHGDQLVFHGIVWQYDKPYGEWRPPRHQRRWMPTIYEHKDAKWEASFSLGDTPLQALTNWRKKLITKAQGEIDTCRRRERELLATLKRLRARDWTKQHDAGKKEVCDSVQRR